MNSNEDKAKLTYENLLKTFKLIKNACRACGGSGYRRKDPSYILKMIELGIPFPNQQHKMDWLLRQYLCEYCSGTGQIPEKEK